MQDYLQVGNLSTNNFAMSLHTWGIYIPQLTLAPLLLVVPLSEKLKLAVNMTVSAQFGKKGYQIKLIGKQRKIIYLKINIKMFRFIIALCLIVCSFAFTPVGRSSGKNNINILSFFKLIFLLAKTT